MTTRLVRYLAQCGVASRRAAGSLVQTGAVRVNGKPVKNVALGIEPGDRVEVDGRPVSPPGAIAVLVLHKPAGLVSSRSDPHNPRTVYECLPPEWRPVVQCVGRLDRDTTGLLLFTNDGPLAFRLSHPRYNVGKTYRAVVRGRIGDQVIARLRHGVTLDDGPSRPAQVRLLHRAEERSEIELTIHEGRKRQIRRMCESTGYPVISLARIRFGPLALGDLPEGKTRVLDKGEVLALREAAGLAPAAAPAARTAPAKPASRRPASGQPTSRHARFPKKRRERG